MAPFRGFYFSRGTNGGDATLRKLQVLHGSPIDNPDLGVVKPRLFDVIADACTNRGGLVSGQRLPGCSTAANGNDSEGVACGKGRADIRLAAGDLACPDASA